MWCLSTGDIPGPLEWQSQSTQRQTTAEGVSSEVAQQCRVNCQGHPFFCPETHGEKRCCWSEGLKNWHRHVTDYCCSWLVILDICYHRCSEWLGWQSQLWSLCDGLKHVEINRCSTRCNFYWINQSLGLLKQAFFFFQTFELCRTAELQLFVKHWRLGLRRELVSVIYPARCCKSTCNTCPNKV